MILGIRFLEGIFLTLPSLLVRHVVEASASFFASKLKKVEKWKIHNDIITRVRCSGHLAQVLYIMQNPTKKRFYASYGLKSTAKIGRKVQLLIGLFFRIKGMVAGSMNFHCS